MARIVIIEDDEMIRPLLVKVVEQMGHEVFAAPNGLSGLAHVKGSNPAVVITDMIMPEKEGAETILELRRSFPAVKIIAISGGGRISSTDCLLLAKRLGAAYTLTKPFGREELKLAIETVLG